MLEVEFVKEVIMSLCQLFLLFRVGVESIIELEDSSCKFMWEEIDEKETTRLNDQRCFYVCGSDVGCRAVSPPVRMAEEAGTKRRFNVEMQVKTESALAKRSRYYHAQMDMDALLTGETYDQLPDTYVIFICDFAPFDSRLYRYNIRNVVRETNELLKDGNQTIILSTQGTNPSEVPVELVNFLKYVGQDTDEAETNDDYVRLLQEQIKRIKQNRDWEGKYMLLEEMMRDEREEGRQEGQERMSQLILLLIKQNRNEDIAKAAADRDYQEQLFKEFNL